MQCTFYRPIVLYCAFSARIARRRFIHSILHYTGKSGHVAEVLSSRVSHGCHHEEDRDKCQGGYCMVSLQDEEEEEEEEAIFTRTVLSQGGGYSQMKEIAFKGKRMWP